MSEHVLIKQNHRPPRHIYHEPSEDDPDQPKCGTQPHISFIRKNLDALPTHRLCKMCAGEHDPAAGNSGPHLSTQLSHMDPDEVGL